MRCGNGVGRAQEGGRAEEAPVEGRPRRGRPGRTGTGLEAADRLPQSCPLSEVERRPATVGRHGDGCRRPAAARSDEAGIYRGNALRPGAPIERGARHRIAVAVEPHGAEPERVACAHQRNAVYRKLRSRDHLMHNNCSERRLPSR